VEEREDRVREERDWEGHALAAAHASAGRDILATGFVDHHMNASRKYWTFCGRNRQPKSPAHWTGILASSASARLTYDAEGCGIYKSQINIRPRSWIQDPYPKRFVADDSITDERAGERG
jgi:hypothetical protein